MFFGSIISELRMNIESNRTLIEMSINKNPALAFKKVNELAHLVGRRYDVELNIHFPDSSKIREIGTFGTENLGLIIDKSRKRFPIPRDDIKKKARCMTNFVEAKDAYMYEGKEGVRVLLRSGRLEIQPGAIHLWCKIDIEVISFVDWLIQCVYFPKK